MVRKYSKFRNPRAWRLAVWMIPFIASAGPLVSRVSKDATSPSQCARRLLGGLDHLREARRTHPVAPPLQPAHGLLHWAGFEEILKRRQVTVRLGRLQLAAAQLPPPFLLLGREVSLVLEPQVARAESAGRETPRSPAAAPCPPRWSASPRHGKNQRPAAPPETPPARPWRRPDSCRRTLLPSGRGAGRAFPTPAGPGSGRRRPCLRSRKSTRVGRAGPCWPGSQTTVTYSCPRRTLVSSTVHWRTSDRSICACARAT